MTTLFSLTSEASVSAAARISREEAAARTEDSHFPGAAAQVMVAASFQHVSHGISRGGGPRAAAGAEAHERQEPVWPEWAANSEMEDSRRSTRSGIYPEQPGTTPNFC